MIIKQSDLKAGDVLLYHGTSPLSDLIRLFDGSKYSHTSIYDGEKVMEALDPGIVTRPVATSIADSTFVDAYRFISVPDKEPLGSAKCPDKPVRDRIAYYQANPQRYAYEQILLLALLAATRRIPVVSWIPGLSLVLRAILDRAAWVLAKLMGGGKEPMICSELVYRCYAEATNDGKYALTIRGADVLAPEAATTVATVAPAFAPNQIMTTTAAASMDPLIDEKTHFLAMYAAAKGLPAAPLIAAATRGSGIGIAAIPDFVTPRDLSRTPNLTFVGTLAQP